MDAPLNRPIVANTRSRRSSRDISERLQGALVVGLLALGAWQGFSALATPAAQRRLAQVRSLDALLDGRAAAAVNFVEAHYLPADPILRAAGGVFRWRLFGSGGPQVAVGCDDWLYLTEEAQTVRGAEENLAARADIVAQVAAALARRGIELVVAVVPDKARIERATLCNAPRTAQSMARYGIFQAMLRERRIASLDLARRLEQARQEGPVYYRTDTHWNQRGAAIAAKAVAEAVTTTLDPGFAYRTEAAPVETDGPGDLLRLMSLDLVPETLSPLGIKLRPASDRQFVARTVQTEKPAEADDLLATGPGDQVVLIGSSYSTNANFQGSLQEALRAPVNNVAEAGGGFSGAASTYFGGSAFAESPPRLIVWEIPERALSKPLHAQDRALAELK